MSKIPLGFAGPCPTETNAIVLIAKHRWSSCVLAQATGRNACATKNKKGGCIAAAALKIRNVHWARLRSNFSIACPNSASS